MTARPRAHAGANWLIGAVAFSRIGALAYAVVMTWAVSKATGNEGVGWVNAAAGLTTVIVGFFATFWLDRFDKRILLLLFDTFAAIACLTAAFVLVLIPTGDVFLVALSIAVATSAVASLYSPTSRALIPSVVPAESLERFNSAYTGFGEVSRAVGPAVGTLVLAVGGPDAFVLSLAVNGASYVISLLLTLPLPADPPRHIGNSDEKRRTFFLGFQFIIGSRALRGEVLSALGINFFLTSTTFVLLNRMIETNAEAYFFGLANLFEALGAIAAALTAAFFAARLRQLRASQLMAPMAIALLLCLLDGIWPTIVSLTVVAALVTIYNIMLFSRLQREVPLEKMGRVIAVVTTGSASLMPFGNLIFSNLSTVMPSVALIWITSAALATTAVIVSAFTRNAIS